MTNERFYALCREWEAQRIESAGGFYEFVQNNYPRVWKYMWEFDFTGGANYYPTSYDMQIILREWQKTHRVFELEIKRMPKRGKYTFSCIEGF